MQKIPQKNTQKYAKIPQKNIQKYAKIPKICLKMNKNTQKCGQKDKQISSTSIIYTSMYPRPPASVIIFSISNVSKTKRSKNELK